MVEPTVGTHRPHQDLLTDLAVWPPSDPQFSLLRFEGRPHSGHSTNSMTPHPSRPQCEKGSQVFMNEIACEK